MTDIERRLRAVMRAAVDGEQAPGDLLQRVMQRHRRHVALMAAASAAGVAIAVTVPLVALAAHSKGPATIGPGGGSTAPAPGPSTPAPSSTPSPSPQRSHTPARSEPAWMRGLAMPPAQRLRLLVTARDPVQLDSPSDVSHPIAGLPRSRFAYSFTRIPGGWAAMPSPKGPACQPDCPGPMLPVYFVADGVTSARRVGETEWLSPGSGHGMMWLETFRHGTTDVTIASATARRLTSSGRQVGSPVRLPTGYNILQGVGSDLLLQPDSEGPGPVILKLWDPRTRRVVRTFTNVIAAGPTQVAWGICAGCPVRVLDLRTGVTTTVRVPARNWAYDGMFSPDGRFLAVHLSGGVTPNGYTTLARVAVIDLRAGRMRILRGSAVGTDLPESLSFGWQGTGNTLIAAVTGRTVTQVATWRPGAAHLLVRKFWLPHGMTVVIGPYG